MSDSAPDTLREPTILYVDDQPSHLALFKKAFHGDYLVLTAGSPEEGLEILEGHDIFLVIADHNMPRMTGVDFLEKAREVSPKAVRVILSAYSNDEIVREAAKQARVNLHISKPWKLGPMREFVEEAWKRYEIGAPTGGGVEQPAPTFRRSVSPQEITEFMGGLAENVDRRGARRIFLKYVEPPLRNFVPTIRRPVSGLLARAHQEALKGNVETVQKILVNLLQEKRC